MLTIGCALRSRPRLLMLGEPTLCLTPLITHYIFRILTDLRQTGVSILLIDQSARAVLDVADCAYDMELGQVTLHGPAVEVAQNNRVFASYLRLGVH